MEIVRFIYVLILAFICMLFPLPLLFKKMSKNICALIHATLFAIVLVVIVPYVQKMNGSEGMTQVPCQCTGIAPGGGCGMSNGTMCNTVTCPSPNGQTCKNPNFGK